MRAVYQGAHIHWRKPVTLLSLRRLSVATAALATVLTLIFSLTSVSFAYRGPEAHVAIETAASLIALLIGFTALGRFLQGGQSFESGRKSDLVLAGALGFLAISNLCFAAIPAAVGHGASEWAASASLTSRLLGAVGLAVAAFIPADRVRHPERAVAPLLAVLLGAVAALGFVFVLLAPRLSLGIDPSLSPMAADRPGVAGHPTLLVVQALLTVLYGAASAGFFRSAERTQDRLMSWLTIAAVLAAFSNLNYFLYPSLYSDWVYTGDFLRMAFWLVLLGGTASQIQQYQSGVADTAALEERRRLARELHDGLAQELAFIATQTRWMSRRITDSDGVEQLADAAERALDESRSAISALTRPMDEPLDGAVAQAAEEVAGRVGLQLKLSLQEGVEVPVETREALVRIVREAVGNATRHGKAKVVTVDLAASDGIRLRISDDGIGFDPDTQDGPGFGLTSMSERARALGGRLNVASTPGAGTAVEVVLP